MKILNFFGLYTKKQYNELLYEKNRASVLWSNNLREIVYDFDKLLGYYGPQQLNSLFYKMINKVRNDKNLSFLLERWTNRVDNAKETLSSS